jgi:glycosyltransferase involved in cell wall biosynthesis
MNILIASTSSGSRGGGELGLLYLGRALASDGHAVTLWASDHPRMDELATGFAAFGEVVRAPYVNTYDRRWRSLASYFDGTTARRVAAGWRALAPDVIHLNKQNLEDGLDLVEAARLSRIPCLAMMHITQSAAYLRAALATLRDFVSRRALHRFPGLLVTTPGSRERDLAEFVGDSRRVRTVLNGVPIPDLAALASQRPLKRAALGVGDDELLFVAIGRMMPQKRPLLFVDLAERVAREFAAARFLWIGDGTLSDEWDRQVAAKSLGDKVHRLSWQADAAAFLAAADIFLHVAEFEGLSFAILEALAAGLPCAITPNLLAEMPFLNSSNSVAVSEDIAWLAGLRDSQHRAALGRAARTLAEKEFSFASMAVNYESLYRETVASKP